MMSFEHSSWFELSSTSRDSDARASTERERQLMVPAVLCTPCLPPPSKYTLTHVNRTILMPVYHPYRLSWFELSPGGICCDNGKVEGQLEAGARCGHQVATAHIRHQSLSDHSGVGFRARSLMMRLESYRLYIARMGEAGGSSRSLWPSARTRDPTLAATLPMALYLRSRIDLRKILRIIHETATTMHELSTCSTQLGAPSSRIVTSMGGTCTIAAVHAYAWGARGALCA